MENVTSLQSSKPSNSLPEFLQIPLSGRLVIILLIAVISLTFSGLSFGQTVPGCTTCSISPANDFTVGEMFLGFVDGTRLPSNYECDPLNPEDVYLFAVLVPAGGGVTRYNLYAMYSLNITTFYPDGTQSTIPSTFSACINTGLTDNAIPTNTPIRLQKIDWTCGQLAEMENIYLSYQTNSNDPCGCEGGRCYYDEGFVINAPLQAQFSDMAECSPGNAFETVTLKSTTIGGKTPYTFEWNPGNPADYTIESGDLDESEIVVTYKSVGSKTVSLKVTDSSSPTITKTATRTDVEVNPCFIIDDVAEDGTFECSNTAGIANWLQTAGGAVFQGGCEPVVWSYSPNPYALSGGCSDYTGSATITFTATDACQNTITTSALLTIEDTTAPTWTNAANALNRTVQCSDAAGLTAAQALVPDATDLCDNTLTPVKSPGAFVAGSCPQAGTITNTWTVTDDCGNASAVYTQVITIVDTTPPTFTKPADKTVYFDFATSCTYDASLAVTGDVTNESDNCSTGLEATYSDVVNSSDPYNIIITRTWSLKDDCNNAAADQEQVITVTRKSVVLTYTGPSSGQYSDPVSLSATLEDEFGALLSDKEITFTIGSQSTTAKTNASGVASATLKLTQPAASTNVATTFAGDCAYKPGSDTDPFAIQREEACGFIDDWETTFFVNTNSKTGGSAEIMIVVILKQDPDDNPGDLSGINLTFDLSPEPSASISLISSGKEVLDPSGDIKFWAKYNVSLTSSLSTTILATWEIEDSDYFTNEFCDEDQETYITVSAPADDFITGGGYIVLETPDGTKKGTIGSKTNFGFNAKWNTNSKVAILQGNFNAIFRIDGTPFQIKSNKPTTIKVDPIPGTTDPVRYMAYVVYSNAILKELGDTKTSTGNATVYLWVEDNGEPGVKVDNIGFAAFINKSKVPWFSTNTFYSPSVRMELDDLEGGNIQIHKSGTTPTKKSAVMLDQLTDKNNGLLVYPNPFSDKLNFELTSSRNSHALLELFDSRGARIEIMLDRRIEADQQYHLEYIPSDVISGMLFYRLTLDNEVINGKVIFNKQF